MKRRRGLVAGVYTTFVMLMNTWSVMLTVLVLNLHHRNECRPIPAWLRIVAFEGLARLLCMYTQQHVLVYQHRIQQRRHTSPGAATSRPPSDAAHRRPRHSLHEVRLLFSPRPHLTQRTHPRPTPTSIPSGILIHTAFGHNTWAKIGAVSYTHLTLRTILRV